MGYLQGDSRDNNQQRRRTRTSSPDCGCCGNCGPPSSGMLVQVRWSCRRNCVIRAPDSCVLEFGMRDPRVRGKLWRTQGEPGWSVALPLRVSNLFSMVNLISFSEPKKRNVTSGPGRDDHGIMTIAVGIIAETRVDDIDVAPFFLTLVWRPSLLAACLSKHLARTRIPCYPDCSIERVGP